MLQICAYELGFANKIESVENLMSLNQWKSQVVALWTRHFGKLLHYNHNFFTF